MPSLKSTAIAIATATTLLLQALPSAAAWNAVNTSLGQQIVVGASYGDLSYVVAGRKVLQSAGTTLVVRNADPVTPIQLNAVNFLSSSGALVKSFLPGPLTIQPLASMRLPLNKATLGINPYPLEQAACTVFLDWQAAQAVAAPTVSSVMYIVRPDGRGILFQTAAEMPATVISERSEP